ncbi:MAG: hypothetical protein HYZ50_19885 [Deltaproteobacteria bacterium]|nr:hypothetical protein [Deltaproteobacteria bacterium]
MRRSSITTIETARLVLRRLQPTDMDNYYQRIYADEIEQRAQTMSSVVSFASEESLRALLATAGFVEMERFFTAYFYGAWVARYSL